MGWQGQTLDAAVLDAIIDAAPIAIGVFDADLRFVRANRAMAELNGMPEEEHVGRRLDEALPRIHADSLAAAQTVLATGEPVGPIEVSSTILPGRHFVVSFFPVSSGEDGAAIACLVQDVTEVKGSAQRLEDLQQLTGRLAGAPTRAEVTDLILTAGRELVDAEGVAAALLDPTGEELVTVGMTGFGENIERDWKRFPMEPATPMSDAVRNDEAVFLETLEDRERMYPHLPHTTSLTLGAVPIRSNRRVIGAIAFRFADNRRLGLQERTLMRTIGEYYGQSLDRARLFEQADAERRRLETLMNQLPVGVAIAEAPSGRIIAVNQRASEIWRVPHPGSEPDVDVSEFVAFHPDGRRYGLDEWPIARSLATGEVVEDEEMEVQLGDGTRGHVSISARPILDEQGAMLGAVTTLVDITERRRREIEARFIADATDLLTESLDPDETLRRLAEMAVPRLADWCSVYIADPAGVRTVAVAHVDPAKVERAWQFDRLHPPGDDASSGVGAVIRTGTSSLTPVITREMLDAVAPDEEFTRTIYDELGLRSVVIVPLRARGRTLGALALIGAESGRIFSDYDMAFAEDFATHAALAIDNARLYREQRDIADVLQRSLLPVRLPPIRDVSVAATYRAAGQGNRVGGDFYDLWEVSPGEEPARFGVVVGDVCGKGAAAAALTALARHTVRTASIALPGQPTAVVLRQLNDAILRRTTADRFCTVALVLGEHIDGGIRLNIGSAGHPVPAIVHPDGTVDRPGTPGTLLGVFSDVVLPESTAVLEPGDTLVMWTDGVPDRRDGGRHFGEERLVALISEMATAPVQEIADTIRREVVVFADSEPQDDIALVVLRFDGERAGEAGAA